jgi:hypothetical protein
MKNALAVLAVTSCIVPLCRAATPPPVPESLLACRKLQDDGERVRCYDAQIAKLAAPGAGSAPARAAQTAPEPAAATPGAATAAASSAARFGEETLPPAAQPKSRLPEETALLSSITALRKASSGTYTISLSNGQIWRQEESSQVAQFLRVGDDVRIEKAALGSYHMSTSSTGAKNWVRVTRIQ